MTSKETPMSTALSASLEIHIQPKFLNTRTQYWNSPLYRRLGCSMIRKIGSQLKLNFFWTSFGSIFFFNILIDQTGDSCFVPALFKYSYPAWTPTHSIHPNSSLASLGNAKSSGTCQNLPPNVYSLCCCCTYTNKFSLLSLWSSMIRSAKSSGRQYRSH